MILKSDKSLFSKHVHTSYFNQLHHKDAGFLQNDLIIHCTTLQVMCLFLLWFWPKSKESPISKNKKGRHNENTKKKTIYVKSSLIMYGYLNWPYQFSNMPLIKHISLELCYITAHSHFRHLQLALSFTGQRYVSVSFTSLPQKILICLGITAIFVHSFPFPGARNELNWIVDW